MTDQLFNNVDVKAQLEEILPKQTKSLAGPASGLLRQFAPRAASDILAQPAVQNQWQKLNYNAHQRFMAIINGKSSGVVQTEQGEVVLDLHPIVQGLADRLGLGAQISPDAGRLVVFNSSQLKLVQDTVKAIKVLSVFLDRPRPRPLRGRDLARGGLAARRAAGHRLEPRDRRRPAARRAADRRQRGRRLARQDRVRQDRGEARVADRQPLLADVAWAIIFYGVAVVIAAWLAGATRPATAVRRWLAPAFKERLGVVVGRRGVPLPAADPLGADAGDPAVVGDPAGRRADRVRRLGAAPRDAAGVPGRRSATDWPDLRAGWNKLRGGSKGAAPSRRPPDRCRRAASPPWRWPARSSRSRPRRRPGRTPPACSPSRRSATS